VIQLHDKRIMVTGGAGFLGGHLVEQLQRKSCRNVVVPLHAEYDLTRLDTIERLFAEHRPQILFHLAAVVGGIGANRENPGRFFYDNAIMGIQLIEAARIHQVEKTVVLGTICAYPKFATIPFQEDNLWGGYPEETNAPYGIAKKALLVQCQAYRQQYGMNAIYLLPVNLYGPRDNFDLKSSHVIPALIRKFTEARDQKASEVVLWGDGSPTREFLYVEDAAEAILLATERYDKPEPVNVGNGMEITIKDLAQKIAAMTAFKGIIHWDTSYPNGQPRRCLDVSRAQSEFAFQARTTFDEGLRKTIDWFQAHKPSPGAMTVCP
jgi:GDP-L-fucose synthase